MRFAASAFAAVAASAVVFATAADAHVERASYWPDPAPDTADGQPTGGEVPAIRSLASALDASAIGETRVVCEGGEALPYRADIDISRRLDQNVSRARVNRLEKKLRKLRRGIKKSKGAKTKKKKRQAKKQKRRLTRVKREYRAALAAEKAAREGGKAAYEAALAAEQAARDAYQAQLASQPSMDALDESIAAARAGGYKLRPSEPAVPLSQSEAAELRDINARLLAKCGYNEIQPAVNDSGNNDRVVVMPGLYTEPTSRSAPENDPSCDQYEEVNDRPDGNGGLRTGANTYTYVFNCPNDQNLIAVLGREPNHAALPPTPLDDRHGIPDLGPCIRCNFQLEGSGVAPDDVVVDGGDPDAGNGADPHPVKDVGIRADRADGFVLTNVLIRHVEEHAIYIHEVDGYVNDRFKTHHAHEYGTLQFTSDHGLIQDCETRASGDAGIYPGSAPDTGVQGVEEKGVTQRYNTEIRRCDMHHNAAGYSGTAANAVWLHDNDFYDNALGFTTDVFTAAGHPGFPQDSDLLENNDFYDNNFNPFVDQPDDDEVIPTIPVPVGTGMWIAGGNSNIVRNNRFWDNWRRGAMLFAVPDSLVCGPDSGNAQHGCDPSELNTSFDNEFHDNVMGVAPGGAPDPNGLDFWWDQFPSNTGNCWFDNTGPDGTRASLAADPPLNPIAGTSLPNFLPEDCGTSVGTGGDNEAELVNCLANFEEGAPTPCTWFTTPPEPQP